jgi:hypothetical protein
MHQDFEDSGIRKNQHALCCVWTGIPIIHSPKESVKMLSRRLVSLIFVLVLVFGTAGLALADAPQKVGSDWCNIWWSVNNTDWHGIEGQGELVYNAKANIYNVSCTATIDFSSDPSWAEFCNWIPGTCKRSTMVVNRLEFWHDYFDEKGEYLYSMTGPGTLKVQSNGNAKWNAQFSPNNCDRGYLTNSVTYELPAGYWGVGTHTYTIDTYYLDGENYQFTVVFDVSGDAPVYRGQVRMGLLGLSNFFNDVAEINPAQDTFLQGTNWVPHYSQIYLFDYAIFTVDDKPPVTIDAGPIHNLCADQHYSWYLRTYGPKY